VHTCDQRPDRANETRPLPQAVLTGNRGPILPSGIAIQRLGIAIPTSRIAIPKLGIVILRLRIAIPAFGIAILAFGIVILTGFAEITCFDENVCGLMKKRLARNAQCRRVVTNPK